MRWRALKLITGLFLVQLWLLLLLDQVNAVRIQPRKQRSKSEVQAQQLNSDYDYEYYENYSDYEEKNGEILNFGLKSSNQIINCMKSQKRGKKSKI
jgi:hypothetical protein